MTARRWREILRSRRVRMAALAGLAVVAGVWLFGGSRDEKGADWVEVEKDDLVLGVPVTGTLKAVESSFLGPPQVPETWNYKISFLAPEGKDVPKGARVLAFDTSELERKLDQKRAEADSARKQIEKKEVDVSLRRRQSALQLAEAEARWRKASLKVDRPGELASAIELMQARLDLDLAERELAYLREREVAATRGEEAELLSLANQRDRAADRVREIQDAIERMSVKAPRNGTVIYATDWREEKKKVGDSCWRGERVLEIPDLRRMAAKGEVDEADSGRIAVGQKVTIRLDAHPDEEFAGRISSIWSTVQRTSWQNPLKVVRLEIELAKTDTQRMRPGMRFRGTIESGRVPQVVVVPSEAVFPTEEGPVAYRRTTLGHERVLLVLGRRNEKEIEVVRGLREGDEVSRRNLEAAS